MFHLRSSNGFSLIELMIVVLIIGIATSFAVFAIDNSDDRLKTEAKRLLHMMQIAKDDAIINSRVLGIVIEENQYSFVLYKKGKWLKLESMPFRTRELSDDMTLSTLISSQNKQVTMTTLPLNTSPELDNSIERLIYFLPTGEMKRSEIRLENNNKTRFLISSTMAGTLLLKQI